MTRQTIELLIFGISLTMAQPCMAQATEHSNRDGDSELPGTRADRTSDGFEVVTHGVWPKAAASETIVNRPVQREAFPKPPIRSSKALRGGSDFRRAAFLPHVQAAEVKHGIPRGLLDAVIWTESRYNPLAVSHAGAAGLGQLMPATARDLGVANRFDPQDNLLGAAKYLKQMLDKFGLVHLALAAYNAGPGAVDRAKGIPRNSETPSYVRKVLDFWGSE